MSNDVDLLAVVNCLQSDALLCGLINAAPPQAIVMPFAKGHARSYLFVAVFFHNENLRKEVVPAACKRVVALLRHKYLATLDGVEILVSVVTANRTERILRLSVLKESLDAFEKMGSLELNTRAPASGITSLMYKQIS
ncbi:hypothetical protein [Dyella subtropica]|uniref:hypothetical protein n=1 Tax=Dyella subtropica TaxID=2992127 RepID=UPI002251D168|nr:hypothetical protein [Dyella subtropica]